MRIALLVLLASFGPTCIGQDEPAAPLRVLVLEDEPRWEYRILVTGLARDPDVDVRVHLRDGGVPGTQTRSAPFPKTREDVASYDVILIGDLSLRQGAALDQDWMLHLMHFLDRGGGVAFLAGPNAMPALYRGTMLERLLPVRLVNSEGERPAAYGTERSTRLAPPEGAALHAVLRLADDDRASAEKVRRFGAVLAPFAVAGLADGATAVLVDPARRIGDAPAVIVAAGRWGQGRTLFLGTDQTYRWRSDDHVAHARFWRNAVRFLANRD